MKRAVILLLVLVAVAILALERAGSAQELGREDAVKLVLQDLAQLKAEGNEIAVLSAEKAGSSWRVRVKITSDAHKACPKVRIATYDEVKPSPAKRIEDVITACSVSGAVAYEEEAIIASAASAETKQFLQAHPDALAYACFGSNCSAPFSFASDFWAVKWVAGNDSLYVAVAASDASIIGVS
jgi:hypothetical protein